MKKRTRNNRNSGFTLIEMLATTGILVILLAVVAVSIARHMDVLEIAERDNAARDIYMAVENRAVLLSGAGRLDDLVPQEDTASPVALGSKTATNYTDLYNKSNLTEVHANPNEKLYFVRGEGIDKELLVTGGVDPTLLDGDFYIVYDLASGSVTDVFYAKEAGALEELVKQFGEVNGDAFAKFYGFWADTRSNRLSLKNSEHNSDKTLVGWYNGEAAESGNYKRDTSVKPFLEVIIDNREKLTVTVTARGEYVDYINELEVWLGPVPALDSEGKPYQLNNTNAISLMTLPYERDSSESDAYSCTWVLDSLIPSETQFKELVRLDSTVFENGGFTLGDDFMVMATITHNSETASAWDVDNSLYQEGSQNDDHVAYIRYLRHLQNLDAENGHNSGVKENITAAFQTADIFVYNNETYPEYSFVPIYNTNLTAYDGFGCEIHRLNVDLVENGGAYSGVTDKASLGLFRETRAEGMEFRNIRLVNATVKAAGSGTTYVGALTGKTHGVTDIQNCWVYWAADGYVVDLKATLGSDRAGVGYNYQLVGDTVGGLVGAANGKTGITESLAATLINGTSAAGGLVGVWNVSDHNADYDISCSYADCYLTGNKKAAGLIGNVQTEVDLQNCYSAGFIVGVGKKTDNDGLQAAGLCLGSGTTTTKYVYTVMQYLDVDLKDIDDQDENGTKQYQISYLTESTLNIKGITHYLGYDEEGHGTIDEGQVQDRLHSHYSEMTSRAASDDAENFADVMNGESGEGKFVWKDITNSFPYNLRETLALSVYSYPGLEGIPHYGDWGAEFKDPSLVYYEYYGDSSWGISGGNARNLNAFDTLSQDESVSILSDGYAVAFLSDEVKDFDDSSVVRINFTYSVLENDRVTVKSDKKVEVSVAELEKRQTSWSDHVVYLIPLPDDLVYGTDARDCFYWFLKFEMYLPGEDNAHAAGEFFYNPHFAETVSPYGTADEVSFLEKYGEAYIETYADGLARRMGNVKIRTPRHLYDLSRFMEYYSQARYTFYQELDLNYATYDWRMMNTKTQHIIADEPALSVNGTLVSAPYKQDPIGDASISFYGVYDGGSHVIKNVQPKVNLTRTNPYAGLFGYSAGRLQNIVYEMSPDGYAPDDRADYTLTAGVENIAGDLYIGALAGCNIGVINNCAVYGVSTDVEAPGVQMYIGGLVGLNNGTITNSAAECAKLAANSYSSGYLYIGGFAGRNSATISNSYAVGRITVDASQGGASDLCGFAGANSVAITDSYAAMYLESSGTGVTRYNFCKDYMDDTNYFLDQGSFSYREKDYAANYQTERGTITYAKLTGTLEQTDGLWERVNGEPVPVSGMKWVEDAAHSPQKTDSVDEPYYPYPTAVTDGRGKPIHYGQWPGAVPMGDFGVLYWEKLANADNPDVYTYHFDALTVDAANGKITERSTLVTSHDDGKVVLAYGYGYYYAGTAPEFSASGLGYFVYTPDVLTTTKNELNRTVHVATTQIGTGNNGYNGVEPYSGSYTGGELTTDRTKFVVKLDGNLSSGNSNYRGVAYSGYKKTAGSNEGLAEVIPGDFTVVSWDSYHEGGRPAEWDESENSKWSGTVDYGTNLSNYQSDRKAASTAGLVPDYGNATGTKSWSSVADGTFTLSQTSGSNTVTVEFVVDPHFAAALSVNKVNGSADTAKTWAQGNTKLTTVPGSKANPFQIRSGSQLQEINTSTSFYTDFCIGMGGPLATLEGKYWDFPTAARFPYLSSVNYNSNGSVMGNPNDTHKINGTTGNDWNKYYRYFYFKQTHDIDWTGEGNTYKDGNGATQPGVFTPIAAAAGRMAQDVWHLVDMPGWFAGSYDGDNYTIKNLHIDINSNDFNTSCIGLFGAVYNNYVAVQDSVKAPEKTKLTNIVLFSESGDEKVIVRGRVAGVSNVKGGGAFTCAVRWYAGGCLVGAALGDCEISNCAVAGYTIIDQTETGADNINYTTNGSSTLSDGVNRTYHYGPDAKVASRAESVRSGLYNISARGARISGFNGTNASLGRSVFYNSNGEVIAGAVGGLVGLTDGNLTNCAAVTTIELLPNHIDQYKSTGDTNSGPNGTNAIPAQITKKTISNSASFAEKMGVNVFYDSCGEGSPVRVGGLVGTTTGTVENCYTGGEIKLISRSVYNDPKQNDGRYEWWATNCTINIGRIAGGVGAGVFKGNWGTGTLTETATIKNCYTYMTMPSESFNDEGTYRSGYSGYVSGNGYGFGVSYMSEFKLVGYQLGGNGEGGVNGDAGVAGQMNFAGNNYYLNNTGGFKVGNNGLTGSGTVVTYQQLSNDTIKNNLGGAYSWVTTTVGADEVTVTGRFSYTPQNRLDLQDMNFPFPTVLKRPHNGQTVNVHYGEWPVTGIKRDAGGTPINLDMFTIWEEEDTLYLTDDLKGTTGTWGTEVTPVTDSNGNEVVPVVAEIVSKPGTTSEVTLTVKAVMGIETPVTTTVTVKYAVSDTEVYTLDIPVNITANIALKPGTVSLYPYDTVTMELIPDPDLKLVNQLYGYTLTIDSVMCVGGELNDVSGTNAEDGKGYVTLTRAGEMSSNTVWVDVTYSYTQNYADGTSHTETGSHRIEVTFLDLPENGQWTTNGSGQLIWTLDFTGRDLKPDGQIQDARILNAGNEMPASSFGAEISDARFILTLKDDFKLPSDINAGFTVLMSDGLEHTLIITVPKPVTGAELEEKLTPVEDDPDEDQPGKSWTIDLTEYKDGLTVELAGETDGVEVVLENGIVTITWDGTGDEPAEVKLKITLEKGDLAQDCVLTVSLSKESDGPDLGSSETAALPPEVDDTEVPYPEDKPDKKDPTGEDGEDPDEEEPDETGDGKKENGEEEDSKEEDKEEGADGE